MSYLLQALKKAELERQAQGESPDVIVPTAVNVASLPGWLIVVVVGLLVVTVFKLFSPQTSENLPVLEPQAQVTELTQPQRVLAAMPEIINKPVQGVEASKAQEFIESPAKTYELAEVPKEVLDLIPTISLQSHIYSSAQEYRSVVINGQTYTEGLFINAQVVLQEITSTGIVINVAGRQIALAKGMSWVSPKNVK